MLVWCLYVVLFIATAEPLFCQPQSVSCEECSQFTYPYRVCPGNKVVCTSNPYSLSAPATFNQICLPANVSASPLAGPADFINNTLHGQDNIYLRSGFQYEVVSAISRWTGVCSGMNRADCKPCPYVVAYWREPEDFEDHLLHFAETMVAYEPDCSRDCFGSGTRLNWTSDFTMGSGVTGRPKRGFYMNIPPSYSIAGNNYVYFHLRTVISHEFGHFLGFAGYREVLCPPMTVENTDNCFMNDFIDYEEERDNPCLWDACQFVLTYCCGTVSVGESSKNDTRTNVQYSFSSYASMLQYLQSMLHSEFQCEEARVVIGNGTGGTVLSFTYSGSSFQEDELQLEHLARGVYVVVAGGCGNKVRVIFCIQ